MFQLVSYSSGMGPVAYEAVASLLGRPLSNDESLRVIDAYVGRGIALPPQYHSQYVQALSKEGRWDDLRQFIQARAPLKLMRIHAEHFGFALFAHAHMHSYLSSSAMVNQFIAGKQSDLIVPLLWISDCESGFTRHDLAAIAACLVDHNRAHDLHSLFCWLIERKYYVSDVFEAIVAHFTRTEAWDSLEQCVDLLLVGPMIWICTHSIAIRITGRRFTSYCPRASSQCRYAFSYLAI